MYFIGIDISKFKHDCAIVNELGEVLVSIPPYLSVSQFMGYLKGKSSSIDTQI